MSKLAIALQRVGERFSDALLKDKHLRTARETLTELGISLSEGTPFELERDLKDKPVVRVSLRTPEQEKGGGIFCDIEVKVGNKAPGREIIISRRVLTSDITAYTRLHFQDGISVIRLWSKVDRVGDIRATGPFRGGMYGDFHYASAEKEKNIPKFDKFLAGFQQIPEISAYVPKKGRFDWKETVKGLVTYGFERPPRETSGARRCHLLLE